MKNFIINEVVTNNNVLENLIKLQSQLQKKIESNPTVFSEDVLVAIQESPKTTQWIKDIVLPGIYNGNEGLNNILSNIETENNAFIGNVKMEIVLSILSTLEESLDYIKYANEEGEYSLEQSMQVYEDEKRPFKTIH